MLSKRTILLFSLLVLVSLVAAQCQQATPAAPAPATEAPAPATEEPVATEEPEEPAPEPVAEFTCDDPIGCVDIPAGDPIRVGYALVISGPNETLGVDSRRGVEIAIDDTPEVLGHPVELVGEDSLCSAEGGQTALTKLVSDPSLVGIIGTNCSSAGEPASKIASDAGMVLISPSNTAPSLTDPDGTWNPGYLRTAHNDNVQGAAMAEFVYNELGLRKAATIHDGSPYADQLQQVFADTFAGLGGEITTQEAVNVGDTDMRPVLTKISATEPEFIYYPIFIAEGAFITTQAKEVAGLEDVILAGADGMISPDFVEAAGEAAEGMYISGPDLSLATEEGQAFLTKHMEKYGEDPLSAFHAHAYDATNMILAAVEQVGVEDADGTLHIPRQALRDALYATSNFDGLTGNLTCTETGDCADPLITVNRIQGGEYVAFWTQGVGLLAEAAEEPAMEGEELVFGIIMVGPFNDHGWSEAHYTGGQYIEENLPGAKMIWLDKLNPADRPETTLEQVVDDMVAQGATLIFTTSDDFQTDTDTVAAKYPDVSFVMISGDHALTGEAPPNVANYMGEMEFGKMIAGCAAALKTETGVIGYLGPLINDETRRLANSAYLGARYCYENYRGGNPDDLEFIVQWIGFWFNIPGVTLDPTEVANDIFNAGADVILSGIDTTEGIVVAGQRAEQGETAWAIPYDYEGACEEAPEICLGVPYFNWGPAYLEYAQKAQSGSFEQEWIWAGPDWTDLNNPDTTAVGFIQGEGLTADDAAQLDEFIAGLADGSIVLFVGPLNYQDGSVYLADGEVASDEQIWYTKQLLEGMTGPSE